MMKPLFWILLLAAPLPAQDEASRQAERLDRALIWLADADPEVREMGRKTLLGLGRAALPGLEKLLLQRGALEEARMLSRIERGGPVENWVTEADLTELKIDEDFQKELKKVDPAMAGKYVHLKYAEAMAGLRTKNYQRGFDIANALLALEPRCPEADAIRRLRRHCEAMITQTTLIEARFLQSKIWFVEGEPLEISARLKNIFRSPLTLHYDKGTPQDPGGGLLVLEVEIQIQEMRGAGLHERKPSEVRFEEEVPIAPGAQWERKILLDATASVPDSEHIRVITVNGWTQPAKIQAESTSFMRRLQFEPAKIRLLPAKYAKFLERPVESLEKAMEGGTVQEVFICSQILEGADHTRGVELLVRWMGRAELELGRIAAAQILTAMTGQELGTDPKRWFTWLQERDKPKLKDKDKNKK